MHAGMFFSTKDIQILAPEARVTNSNIRTIIATPFNL